ncbi:MAG: serine/threonine-protein kinase [Luteolibacter sp.]
MTEKTPCKSCDRTLPDDAPGGLCPACVMLAAAENETPVAAPSVGEIQRAFPQLEILEFVGRGGMGIVYKAFQPHLGRHVALKLLDPGLHANPDFAERFAREARFLGKLAHPNIVAIHDFGETGGYFWLMMEYVDGVNLRQAMQAGRFSAEQALAVIPEICTALQFAHDQGVLHRDIKPENILLDTKGHVKIADFGIARLVDGETDFTLTHTGSALGSTAYIAPEQIESPHDVDHRADIYSLGVVFYEMLTGGLPIGRFPAPSEKSASDPRLDEVVFRALEKEREKRYQSADEVKTGVRNFQVRPLSGSLSYSGEAVGLPKSVKLPLLLIGGGFTGLVLIFLSLPEGMGENYWRLLTFRSGGFTINIPSGLRIFLNLWFGISVIAMISGFALGMRTLDRIRKGHQSPDGWIHLRRFVLWPLVCGVPTYVFNWLFNGSGSRGENPIVWGEGVLPIVQAILFGSVFAASLLLFHFGGPPVKRVPSSPWKRRVAVGLSLMLFFSASAVTKRLYNHYTELYLPFELSWDVSNLSKSERDGLGENAWEAGGDFRKRLSIDHDDKKLTASFLIARNFSVFSYQNAFVQRFTALAPEHVRPLTKRPEYTNTEWLEAKKSMHWPTVYVVLATVLSALLAACCGPFFGISAAAGSGILALILWILPAWPIPQGIQRRVIREAAPVPLLPLTPDFSEPVTAVQTVLNAAYFGDVLLVKQGMSKRLLAELDDPRKFQEAMVLLKERMWAASVLGNEPEKVSIECATGYSWGPKVLHARTAVEKGQRKLDELPRP